MVQQIVQELRNIVIDENDLAPPNLVEKPEPTYVHEPPAQSTANAVIVPPETDQLVLQLQADLEAMHHQVNGNAFHNRFSHRGRGGRGWGGRGPGRGRDPGRGQRRGRGGVYCHSHGNCAHLGTNCEHPLEGHIATATFANMQGGSTRGCLWKNGTEDKISSKINKFCFKTTSVEKNVPTYNAFVDSVATYHFLQPTSLPACANIEKATGPKVAIANGKTITPQSKAHLNLSKRLSLQATKSYTFDDLKTGSLLSLGQLCDDDCIAIFTKYDVDIIKDGKIIIKVKRTQNKLWSVPLPTPKASPSPPL